MSQTYALYDIVDKVNGGGIIPIGETNYDNKAFMRMKEIESLIDCLVDDMLRVYEQTGYEASIQEAHREADKYLWDLKVTLDDWLVDKHISGKENE